MATSDDISMLAKHLLEHKTLISVLFGVSNDFVRLIEHALDHCSHEGCHCPATVRHADMGIKFCDYHAATAVVNAQKHLSNNTTSEPILMTRFIEDDCWLDLPNAEQIRRVVAYVNELRKNEEPELPLDSSQCH